jgi:hypothetical protein
MIQRTRENAGIDKKKENSQASGPKGFAMRSISVAKGQDDRYAKDNSDTRKRRLRDQASIEKAV